MPWDAPGQKFSRRTDRKNGEFLVEQLKEAGVNTDPVVVDEDCSTGHAIIQNDAEGDNCILLYGGANQRITKEQIDAALEQFDAGDYLVLQNEISNLPYLMEKAAEKQMKIVLNPSPMDEKKSAPFGQGNAVLCK